MIRGRYPVLRGSDMPTPERWRYELYPAKSLQHMVDSAKRVIRKAFERFDSSEWCVSVSFGKDSIVLLDIVLDIAPEIDILFVHRGLDAELPETEDLIEAWQAYRPFSLHIVKPEIGLLDLYRQLGGIPGITVDAPDSVVRETILAPPSDGWMVANGKVGHLMGRRAQENKRTRGTHFQYRGPIHFNKSRGLWTCDPLFEWAARDIWAYIVQRDLPYHPAYDLDIGIGREEARLSNWSGMTNAPRGRFVLIYRHYPELWNYLAGEFTEVRGYT